MRRPRGPIGGTRAALAVVVLALAGSAACTAIPGAERTAVAPDATTTAPDGSEPDVRRDDDADPPRRPATPAVCDRVTAAAVSAPVVAQLDALAGGDFAAAYAQASPFFRTMVAPDGFAAIIRDGYPELLDVTARRLEACRVMNLRAVLVVTVTTSTGSERTLAYELSETSEGWRIDGAGDVAPGPSDPSDPLV